MNSCPTDVGIGGVAHHHPGFEPRCGDAGKAAAGQEFGAPGGRVRAAFGHPGKSRRPRFSSMTSRRRQAVGGHGGVVGVAAVLKASMICSHFLRSQAKLVLVVASIRPGRVRPAPPGRSRGTAPAFLGALMRTSTPWAAMSTQTVPEAMQSRDEEAARFAHRSADGLQVGAGEHHAGSRFDMGGEDDVGPVLANGGDDLRRWGRARRGLGSASHLAGLEDHVGGGDAAHLEDLGPAEAEPAVADDQRLLAAGELAGHRFHAESAPLPGTTMALLPL